MGDEHTKGNEEGEETDMTVEELQREQERLAPKDDLSVYAGEWVALRDGHVIAHALDPVTLRDMDEVRHTDDIIPVADTDADLLLL